MDDLTLLALIGAAVLGLLAVLSLLRRERHEAEATAGDVEGHRGRDGRDEALPVLRDGQPRHRCTCVSWGSARRADPDRRWTGRSYGKNRPRVPIESASPAIELSAGSTA